MEQLARTNIVSKRLPVRSAVSNVMKRMVTVVMVLLGKKVQTFAREGMMTPMSKTYISAFLPQKQLCLSFALVKPFSFIMQWLDDFSIHRWSCKAHLRRGNHSEGTCMRLLPSRATRRFMSSTMFQPFGCALQRRRQYYSPKFRGCFYLPALGRWLDSSHRGIRRKKRRIKEVFTPCSHNYLSDMMSPVIGTTRRITNLCRNTRGFSPFFSI